MTDDRCHELHRRVATNQRLHPQKSCGERGLKFVAGVWTEGCDAIDTARGLRSAPAGGMLVLMSDVTQILNAIEAGDPSAAEQLLPLVYDELRKLAAQRLAQEQPGQTLQATALVHEAYLRLVGPTDAPRWEGRGHFFAAAVEAMRRILIENARRKKADIHGKG